MFSMIILFQLIQTYQGYLNTAYQSNHPDETLFIADHLYQYHQNFKNLELFLNRKESPKITLLKRWLLMKHLIHQGDEVRLETLKREMGFPDMIKIAYRGNCTIPMQFKPVQYNKVPTGILEPNQFFHLQGNGCFFVKIKPEFRNLYLSSKTDFTLYMSQKQSKGIFLKKGSYRNPHIISVIPGKTIILKLVMNGDQTGIMIRNRDDNEFISMLKSSFLRNFINDTLSSDLGNKRYPFIYLPRLLKVSSSEKQIALIKHQDNPQLKGYLNYLYYGLKNHRYLQERILKKLHHIFPDEDLVNPEYQRLFGQDKVVIKKPSPSLLGDANYRYHLLQYGKHQSIEKELLIWAQLLHFFPYNRDLITRYCRRMIQFPDQFNINYINSFTKELPDIRLLLAEIALLRGDQERHQIILKQLMIDYPAFQGELFSGKFPILQHVPEILIQIKEQIDARNDTRVVFRRKEINLDERMNYIINYQEAIYLSQKDQAVMLGGYAIDYIDLEERVTIKKAGLYRNGNWIPIRHYTIAAPYDRADFYSDLKVIQYHLKDEIQPGDTFYISYTLKSSSKRNYFNGMYSSIERLTDPLPVEQTTLKIRYPKSRELYYYTPDQELLEEKSTDERYHTLIFSSKDLPGEVYERYPVPLLERVPYVVISTFKEWRDVRNWFNRLIKPVKKLKREDRSRIKKMVTTAKLTHKEEIIRYFYNHLMKQIRYIGIELGVHSYKPYAPERILEKGYGDCKDRANLFVELLKIFNIPAEIVLVRTQQFGSIPQERPAHIYFNHAIVYLPQQKIYLDLTDPEIPFGELPQEDFNSTVFHLSGKRGVQQLKAPSKHVTDLDITYEAGAKRDLKMTMKQSYQGVPGQHFRQSIDQQRPETFLEPLLHRYFQRPIDLKSPSFLYSKKIITGWVATVTLSDQITRGYTIIPFFKKGDLWEPKLARQRSREGNFRFLYRFEDRRYFHLKGAILVEGFSPITIENDYFSFSLKTHAEGVESIFKIKVLQIPKDGYEHFKQELHRVDQVLRREYRIKWKK